MQKQEPSLYYVMILSFTCALWDQYNFQMMQVYFQKPEAEILENDLLVKDESLIWKFNM